MNRSFGRFFHLGHKAKKSSISEITAAIDDLIEDKEEFEKIESIAIDEIIPNPYQPREVFEEQKIKELAQSIQTHGLIQPIVLRKSERVSGGYEIVSGERRYRALCMLGKTHADCIIRTYDNKKSASVALIENIQRENLNPLEEARAFQSLIELFGLTQEALAQRLGKGQSTIANKMRLLQLPNEVQEALLSKQITERHGRALLGLKDEPEKCKEILQEIMEYHLNVKQTEELIAKLYVNEQEESDIQNPKNRKKRKVKHYGKNIRLAVNELNRALKTMDTFGYSYKKEESETDDFYQITIQIPKQDVNK